MSNKIRYGQCLLIRSLPNGATQRTTTYLPEEFAFKGSVVKLKDEQDNWTNGWVVQNSPIIFTDSPPDWRKGIREHKKTTGDSLPKKPNHG